MIINFSIMMIIILYQWFIMHHDFCVFIWINVQCLKFEFSYFYSVIIYFHFSKFNTFEEKQWNYQIIKFQLFLGYNLDILRNHLWNTNQFYSKHYPFWNCPILSIPDCIILIIVTGIWIKYLHKAIRLKTGHYGAEAIFTK